MPARQLYVACQPISANSVSLLGPVRINSSSVAQLRERMERRRTLQLHAVGGAERAVVQFRGAANPELHALPVDPRSRRSSGNLNRSFVSMVNLVEYLLDSSILGQNSKIISQGLIVNDPKFISLFV
jgi:hypothetical protein